MRKVLWISLMSAAIATTGACKKREEKNYESASKTVEKAKDDVREQEKDVRNEQKDVTKEQKDVNEEQRDVQKQQGELQQAKGDLARARVDYLNATRSRIATLDMKLDELSRMTTDEARQKFAGLKQRRDLLANRLHDIETRNADISNDFRKDVDDSFDKLEKDVNDALK